MLEWKSIGSICSSVFAGGTPNTKKAEYYDGNIPWIRSGEIDFNVIKTAERNITQEGYNNSSAKMIRKNSVVMAMTGATVAKTAVVAIETTANQSVCALETDESKANYKYVYYCLAKNYFKIKSSAQGALTSLNLAMIKQIEIPVPSLSEQSRIVSILDTFTDSIDNLKQQIEQRRKQYEHYRDQLLEFKGKEGVEMKALEEICNITAGGDVPSNSYSKEKTINYYIPIISNGIGSNAIYGYTETYKINQPSVTIAARGTIGYAEYRDYPYYPIVRLISVSPFDQTIVNTKYLYYRLVGQKYNVSRAGIPQLTVPMVKKVVVKLPDIEEQSRIVSILDTFEASIANLEEQLKLREKQYEYYRNKLLTFE